MTWGQSLCAGQRAARRLGLGRRRRARQLELLGHQEQGGRYADRPRDPCRRPRGLVAATHALDRVLLHGYYVIPNWHLNYFRVAEWDKFGAAGQPAAYALALDTWWIDRRAIATSRRKSSRCRSNARLCGAADAADRPDALLIILVNFVIVQAAPGGPVDQLIAQFKGTAGGTLSRVSGGGGELGAATSGQASARRARPRSANSSSRSRSSTASTSRRPSASWLMIRHYLTFDFGKSFFRDRPVIRPHRRQAAGVDLARPVDDAADLSRLDPARHPQGGARRQPLRRVDQRRRSSSATPSRASCSPCCSSCCSPAAAISRGFRCAASSPTTGRALTWRTDPRLFLAHRPAGHRRW